MSWRLRMLLEFFKDCSLNIFYVFQYLFEVSLLNLYLLMQLSFLLGELPSFFHFIIYNKRSIKFYLISINHLRFLIKPIF